MKLWNLEYVDGSSRKKFVRSFDRLVTLAGLPHEAIGTCFYLAVKGYIQNAALLEYEAAREEFLRDDIFTLDEDPDFELGVLME